MDNERSGRTPEDDVETVSGVDQHSVVTIEVTVSDGLVVSIELSPRWRKLVRPKELRTHFLEALRVAQGAALARQLEEHEDIVADAPVPEGLPATPEDAAGYVENLALTVLDQLEEYQERLTALVTSTVEVESAGRHVIVDATGGQVTDIDFDPRWVARADPTVVAGEVLAGVRRAQRDGAERLAEAVRPSGEMTELTALVSDPRQFVSMLGLGG